MTLTTMIQDMTHNLSQSLTQTLTQQQTATRQDMRQEQILMMQQEWSRSLTNDLVRQFSRTHLAISSITERQMNLIGALYVLAR